MVRYAAENSIHASSTTNPIIALMEVTKAVQLIEALHWRYGPEIATEMAKTDTQDILQIVQDQKERILQDIVRDNPQFLLQHPLNAAAKLVNSD